jgi:hypothetical protein
MEIPHIADVEVEHDQEASMIGGEAAGMERKGRKSVLNVTLDKMDIMRGAAKGCDQGEIVDERRDPILASPTRLGSAALSPVSSTRAVTKVEGHERKADLKQENIDRFRLNYGGM